MKKDLIFVIFGSTGDLTARKLLPAITNLYKSKSITENLAIVSLGRRPYDTEGYISFMETLTETKLNAEFLKKHLTYYQMQVTEANDYVALSLFLNEMADEHTKFVYYLAVGPELLPILAENLNQAGLIKHNNPQHMMVFEKPFGHDLASAREINQMLFKYFDESQIYRIDHYLGKEMIQNIMTVRFANRIFEDLWNAKAIADVKIIVKEKDGILNRAGYYDKAGALKDMVQSHLLQMLSLVAMDAPKTYSSQDIKDEKIKVLKSLSFEQESLIFGQYEGYLSEPNIPETSKTETFVFLKAFVNTERFAGVPFYLMTGKKLDKKESVIEITFKPTNEQTKWGLPLGCNKLYIKIAPHDGVDLAINSKAPGLKENIETVHLSYHTANSIKGNIPEAYEKLLLDVTLGNKTLYTRWDEIEYAWQFIDAIKKHQKHMMPYASFKTIKKVLTEKHQF